MVMATKTPQGARLNPQNTLELSQSMSIQTAINTADAHGGNWTILVYPGTYNERDLTPSGAANITIKAMGEGRVVIAPVAVPVTAVIVSGFTLNLEDITVTAPDATRPALRTTGGTCSASRCEFNGVGVGNVVQQVGGILNIDICSFNQGNINLSTAICTLRLRRSRILNGNLNTAGAFAHTIRAEYTDFNNNNFNNLATGATVIEIEACSELNTFTDASLLGTVGIRRSNLISGVKNGTSPWLAYGGRFGLLANNNAVGGVAVYNGFVYSIVRAIGSIVQWQDENTLKVIPSGTATDRVIQWAITAAGAGDVILIHPGTYQEGEITPAIGAGVTLKGIGEDRVTIASAVAPATAVIVSNGALTLENLIITAPDATKPALFNNAGITNAKNCDFNGVGAGDSIDIPVGTVVLEQCYVNCDIELRTNNITFTAIRCRIEGGINTAAAAQAHVMTLTGCDLAASNIASAATGATTLTMQGCTRVGTISNAGTGAFAIRDSDVATVTASSTGTIVVIGGYVNACGGATAAVTWQTGPIRYEALPNMRIQDSLTAGAGGEVIIHAGAYAPTANLTVSANTLVRGEGEATIITPTGAAITNGMILNGNNSHVKDLKIILAPGVGAGGSRPNVIYGNSMTLLWLENLWLVGDTSVADDGTDIRQNGVYFTACTGCNINSCRIEDSRRSGLHLRSASNLNTITGNHFQGNFVNGIYLYGALYNSLSGNICQGNTSSGIMLTVSSNSNTVTGNTCQGNGAYGIYNAGTDRNTYTGNTCQGNGTHGVYIFRSSYCVVTGNSCNGQTTGDGINVTGDGTTNADYNTITGNVCTLNGDDGIEIAGGANANKNIVLGNQLLGNTGTPLVDGGNNTEVAHNIAV